MPLVDNEKRNAYLREWSSQNKDKVRKYAYDYRKNNRAAHMLKVARQRAKKQGWDFNIELEDIIIPEVCPYLGITLTHEVQQINTASTVSLDRIDSSKGYVKGNVQVISRLANLMKSYATEEQLIQFAKSILEIHGE